VGISRVAIFIVASYFIGSWIQETFSNELVVYSASCSNGVKIRPLIFAVRTGANFNSDYERYNADRRRCVFVPGGRTTYKLNEAKGEVYYDSLGGSVDRLVNCAINNVDNWSCEYPNGSGRVVVIDGLPAVSQKEASTDFAGNIFYVRWWQWWAGTLYWWIGKPQGKFLIPEQKHYWRMNP
jgi:hypothetical protein